MTLSLLLPLLLPPGEKSNELLLLPVKEMNGCDKGRGVDDDSSDVSILYCFGIAGGSVDLAAMQDNELASIGIRKRKMRGAGKEDFSLVKSSRISLNILAKSEMPVHQLLSLRHLSNS